MADYIQIQWQDGVVSEHGVNGAQMADVLQVLIDRMEYLQGRASCEENLNTLAALHVAQHWDRLRTKRRQAQGVEGTEQAHVSERRSMSIQCGAPGCKERIEADTGHALTDALWHHMVGVHCPDLYRKLGFS